MNTPPKALHLPPVLGDRDSENLLQQVTGVRGAFDPEAPELSLLVRERVRQRILTVYGREATDGEVAHPSADDRNRATAAVGSFRHRGYVFGRIGTVLVGVSETAMKALKAGSAPLGRAANTGLAYAIHVSQLSLRAGHGEECTLDLDVLRLLYDPTNSNPNSEQELRDALTVLGGTTICLRDEELGSTTFTPVFKKCKFLDDSRNVVVAVNEHFMGCVSRIVEAGKRLNRKELKAALNDRTYFHDSGARLLVSNLPPTYSAPQRRLQSHLFSEMSRRTDRPRTKLIRKGTVLQWIERLGYQGGSASNRLDRFLVDIERVVIVDADGRVEPTPAHLRTLPTSAALQTKIQIILPADFAVNRYPKLIEEKAGIIVTGNGIERDAMGEVRAIIAAGITGADLRAYRTRLGLTQAEVATTAGVGLRTVIRLEQCADAIAIDRLIKIGNAMGIAHRRKRNVPFVSETQSGCATNFRNSI